MTSTLVWKTIAQPHEWSQTTKFTHGFKKNNNNNNKSKCPYLWCNLWFVFASANTWPPELLIWYFENHVNDTCAWTPNKMIFLQSLLNNLRSCNYSLNHSPAQSFTQSLIKSSMHSGHKRLKLRCGSGCVLELVWGYSEADFSFRNQWFLAIS